MSVLEGFVPKEVHCICQENGQPVTLMLRERIDPIGNTTMQMLEGRYFGSPAVKPYVAHFTGDVEGEFVLFSDGTLRSNGNYKVNI